MENIDGNKMQAMLDWAYDKTLNGLPGTLSAEELANNYLKKHKDEDKAIKKLVKNQLSKTGTSGFLTGLGGMITLPVAVPANIASVIYVQMRMIAAIAHIRGYDLKDDEVKTLVYLCLTGQTAGDILKDFGVKFAQNVGKAQIKRIPGSVLVKINQKIGFRLVTKFGEKGLINLGKMIPVLGGAVGASFDVVSTRAIAEIAKKTFEPFDQDNDRVRIIIN
ncbi:EcsC family protein [Staphylococcus hominis]|uniref:EcsC family protein n=1 Tax=Staphylococcus hominis TaxID=1290 RepID=UPI002E19B8D1|nr:EcsC family protein [Staphylococcus hominis]